MIKGPKEWERYEFGKKRSKILIERQLMIEGVTNAEIMTLIFCGPKG
jgi:hypothetical protein